MGVRSRFAVLVGLASSLVAGQTVQSGSTLAPGPSFHGTTELGGLRRAYALLGVVGTARFDAYEGDDHAAWLGFTSFDPRWVAAESAAVRSSFDRWIGAREGAAHGLVIVSEKRPDVPFAMVGERSGPLAPLGLFWSEGVARAAGREVLFGLGVIGLDDVAAELDAALADVVLSPLGSPDRGRLVTLAWATCAATRRSAHGSSTSRPAHRTPSCPTAQPAPATARSDAASRGSSSARRGTSLPPRSRRAVGGDLLQREEAHVVQSMELLDQEAEGRVAVGRGVEVTEVVLGADQVSRAQEHVVRELGHRDPERGRGAIEDGEGGDPVADRHRGGERARGEHVVALARDEIAGERQGSARARTVGRRGGGGP